MSASTSLAWGILGTGTIAKTFARGLAKSANGRLVAVASRSRATAESFTKEFGGRAYDGYDALLSDPEVQAVYISLPHTLHAEWTIRACDAGNHVLCEKPLAVNHAEAMTMVEAAQRNGVFLMEAFMYRCHPQAAKVAELVRAGAIGEVRLIEATFAFQCDPPAEHRLVNQALAGGGILDVGCYPISFARLIAGAASGRAFADPIEVKGVGSIGATRVDDYAAATLKFPGGIIAQVATGIKLSHDNVATIWGSTGSITVPSAWIPARDGGETTIVLRRHGQPEETIRVNTDRGLYALEADHVAEHLTERQSPAMSWNDSLGNMRALDRWREQIGLVYDSEKPDAGRGPCSGRPLRVRQPTSMPYADIAGVGKPVSRLIMGVDNQNEMPHLAALFDDFFERGGNCFDTAHCYGANKEKLFGRWIRDRGIRDQVVIICKGAHTPNCNPTALTSQLGESMDRLGVDRVDIYLLHRDNHEIPVGEFVEALNEHHRAGRIGAFGGSNWTVARMQAANDYAAKKGLRGFTAVSNNFSLARMIEPVWGGCVSSSDPDSRAWLTKNDFPVLSWSSQARGFFTETARPDGDAEMKRCWYSDDNWKRRERALELAKKRGVEPINIALAWVLRQPFPTFALIGPRTIAETRSSMRALDLRLTAEEAAWLDLAEAKKAEQGARFNGVHLRTLGLKQHD